MDIKELIARIRALDRYDCVTEYGCSCCADSVYGAMERDVSGDYVRVDDLKSLLKEFENGK